MLFDNTCSSSAILDNKLIAGIHCTACLLQAVYAYVIKVSLGFQVQIEGRRPCNNVGKALSRTDTLQMLLYLGHDTC